MNRTTTTALRLEVEVQNRGEGWRGRLAMRWSAVVAAGVLLGSFGAAAQQDVTPPLLLEFSISPIVIDTGRGPATLTWCATAQDDLAGVWRIEVGIDDPGSFGSIIGGGAPVLEGCNQFTLPQFYPYGTRNVIVRVRDLTLTNDRIYADPATQLGAPDLCAIGPCHVENRDLSELPDSDADGIPDDADNCPDDPNPDQADRDLDLIGDVCDSFPDDRDNEQAQCEVDRDQALADLEQALADLERCQNEPRFLDADADGEHDPTDLCPGTAPGDAVDAAGCSRAQFCGTFDVSTENGRASCSNADWRSRSSLTHSSLDHVALAELVTEVGQN